jgi:hypothetical protein
MKARIRKFNNYTKVDPTTVKVPRSKAEEMSMLGFITNYKGNHIEWNHKNIDHNLIDRIRERSNLTIVDFNEKIKTAIDRIITYLEVGDFKIAGDYGFIYTISDFKVVISVNPYKEKSILIRTILDKNMKLFNTIKNYHIYECQKIFLLTEDSIILLS